MRDGKLFWADPQMAEFMYNIISMLIIIISDGILIEVKVQVQMEHGGGVYTYQLEERGWGSQQAMSPNQT